ncbi:MAG: hypothetical protein AAF492_01695 [Verrucomicrobiota bacterium]
MAKKIQNLTRSDIILGADAETIRSALEARMEIDELLVARLEAYQKIAELEERVEGAIGEPGMFSFPEPPLPVAGWSKMAPASRPKPAPATPVLEPEPVDIEIDESEAEQFEPEEE